MLDESRVLDILRQTPASRFGNAEELIGATLLLALLQGRLLYYRYGNDRRWRLPGDESVAVTFGGQHGFIGNYAPTQSRYSTFFGVAAEGWENPEQSYSGRLGDRPCKRIIDAEAI